MSASGHVRPTLRGHLAICRVDHWFKNVFVLPGVVVAFAVDPSADLGALAWRLALGLLSICLVASSNYTINELLDRESDLAHPTKHLRPVPAGEVALWLGYVQWIVLAVVGIGLGWTLGTTFAAVMVALWVMGCLYNIPPARTKDLPYLDVISEAVNNPLRLQAGWYIVDPPAIAPASLLISYWMIGCYFMGMKRFAEYRQIGDAARSAAYRRSFGHYDESRLLVSIVFYGSASMLFFGAFIMRYRLELVLAFPLVAIVMAVYMQLGLLRNSPVQTPELLYRERGLMLAVTGCALVMALTLFVDIPLLHEIFVATLPVP